MEENKTVVVGRLLLYRGPLYRGYTVLSSLINNAYSNSGYFDNLFLSLF